MAEFAAMFTLPEATMPEPFNSTTLPPVDFPEPSTIAPVEELMLPPKEVPTAKLGVEVVSAIKLVKPAPVLSRVTFAPVMVPEL